MSAPNTPDGGEVLLEHAKGRGRAVRLAARSYKGRRFLELREWFEAGDGAMAPGRGATVPLERAGDVHAALGAYLARNAPSGRPDAT